MNEAHNREAALFNEAVQFATPEARVAFLANVCCEDATLRQRVEALLQVHDEAKTSRPDSLPMSEGATESIAGDSQHKPGDRIGPYKLLQQIGEGGFGVVYMAEQEAPFRRHVALKVIKLGMDTRSVIARFEAERQALAMMDHPNIARVLDAGATDTGRPYFVMELVRGVPITAHCDQHHLSTHQRLGLFALVCHAIQHAHQKGIIHRDIKPSNILVTLNDDLPVPKVIDFGIAKCTTGLSLTDKTVFTALQQFVGTPAYMSPEQTGVSGLDVDTRSDIYALGVLLYELLTGKTPFDAKELVAKGLEEIRRIIRDVEPPRPSTRLKTLGAVEQTAVAKRRHSEPPKLIGLISGDLDWIVMKTLEKDRTRRYDTANSLALDIQRYLNNEPIFARPPSQIYRIQKLARRHKLAFSAAAAVLLALVLGLGGTMFMFFREQAARQRADAATGEAVQSKREVERKNAAYRAMLVEAARSDSLIAADNMRLGRQHAAFAYLARATEYDPSSMVPAEAAIVALNVWHFPLPTIIFPGHKSSVTSAQFSPDGMRILTASYDRAAQVWDAASGNVLATLAGHVGGLKSAQFSPDGTRIVTVPFHPHVVGILVWDVATGKMLTRIRVAYGVSNAQFSLGGARIVTASNDGTAQVWDAATGELLATVGTRQFVMCTPQFSQDGTILVTASDDYAAQMWDVATGKELFKLTRRRAG